MASNQLQKIVKKKLRRYLLIEINNNNINCRKILGNQNIIVYHYYDNSKTEVTQTTLSNWKKISNFVCQK